jgi:hypothetical protein
VLERDHIGHEWRDRRWDSFCLVTPNWRCNSPRTWKRTSITPTRYRKASRIPSTATSRRTTSTPHPSRAAHRCGGPNGNPLNVNLSETEITSVIWSTGFGRDDRWIEIPVFDGRGYPTHDRGVTSSPGLYFLGLPWQHIWGSGRFSGVAEDAAYLTERITTGPDHHFRWIAGTSASTFPGTASGVAPARWRADHNLRRAPSTTDRHRGRKRVRQLVPGQP